MSEPETARARQMWSAAYRSFIEEGVSEAHSMARADLIRIEFEKHTAAPQAAPAAPAAPALDVERLAEAIRSAKAEYPGLFVDWAAASEHTCRAIAATYARLANPEKP